jgi:ankyrin repeat protein
MYIKSLINNCKKMRLVSTVFIISLLFEINASGTFKNAPDDEDTLQYMAEDNEYNLVVASIKGDFHIVESLINKDISPNTVLDESLTPLIYATQGGQLKICSYLISKGADVNFRPVNGPTPLVTAVKSKQYHIVNFLLEKGADINLGDDLGRTPLMYAVAKGDTMLFEKFIKLGSNIHHKDTTGTDALICATVNNQIYFVEQLIKAGASVNTNDVMGVTPIMIATGSVNYKLLDVLINSNADVNKKSKNKQSALLIAIEKKDETLVQYLIDHGADVNQKLTFSETPLSVADYFGCDAFIIDALTNKNAKKGILPDFRKFSIGPEISWNLDEFMTGISIGLKDYRYNSDFSIGFLTRPFPSRILVEAGTNEYYQYWEKRSYIFVSVQKKIAFQYKANDLQRGIYLGFKGLGTYYDYRGTDTSISMKFVPCPEIGFYQSNKYFQACISYMFANFSTEGVSDHKINVGFKFFLGRAFNFSNEDYKPWK